MNIEELTTVTRVITNNCVLYVAASYFALVATIAAFTGQHVVRKVIVVLGRASIIIFILALTIFISAISLGTFYGSNWNT